MTNKFTINSDFTQYKDAFLEENSKHNLISKNDEKLLWEKHIYDSLSIKLFFEKYDIKKAEIQIENAVIKKKFYDVSIE